MSDNTTQTPMVDYTVPLPADFDVLLRWANVARRLAHVAAQTPDALITITVQVDVLGRPVRWTEPKHARLEPRR